MKNNISLFLAILLSLPLLAQTPNGFTFQAIIRDAKQTLVIDQVIGVQISILRGAPNGVSVYEEFHNPQTNSNGLISLEIGTGYREGELSEIDWSDGPYFIKLEVDPDGGENFSIECVSQLLSVPYALHAKTADSLSGDTFNVLFSSLDSIPKGLLDGDDNTQLTEGQVDVYVGNNGYLTKEIDGSVSNELQTISIDQNTITLSKEGGSVQLPAVSFKNLLGIPQTLDTDNTDDFDGRFTSLTDIPEGLLDGDDNTQLTEGQVDVYVGNNGYLTKEIDGSVSNELQTISIDQNTITLSKEGGSVQLPAVSFKNLLDIPQTLDTDNTDDFDGRFTSLTDIPEGLLDGDDNTQLTEGQVDAYVSNNGYLELLENSIKGDVLYFDGGNWNRLPKGEEGQVLSSFHGLPRWNDVSDVLEEEINRIDHEYVADLSQLIWNDETGDDDGNNTKVLNEALFSGKKVIFKPGTLTIKGRIQLNQCQVLKYGYRLNNVFKLHFETQS